MTQRPTLSRPTRHAAMTTDSDSDLPTLDPPGSIVVLGTTPVGVEAALYGRFLGYNVTLIAAVDAWTSERPDAGRIGPTFQDDWFARHWLGEQSIASRWDDAMPMMPDQCLSPLATEAIAAQRDEEASALPISMRQWIQDGLQAILETDLLRGRCFADTFVESMALADVSVDEEGASEADSNGGADESDDEIPPDFVLTLRGEPIGKDGNGSLQCECIIVADVPLDSTEREFDLPADYFFEIASADHSRADDEIRAGWRRITEIYAQLAGRAELDLYRPRRL
ncbi:hypothetical protein [Allorhodopirellula solitaria]|uniref:Uncharacterized protein n=1 Tax=Allorhodopirellula solitaria TaxID=2527987 RepID=A0A5C5YDC2_9BACT|nr:hypothetical protein [Allorhodopirellula solitaria]TWT73094.1 hypothetical protein CA85_15610 [Allorhodopirellula solitaria]